MTNLHKQAAKPLRDCSNNTTDIATRKCGHPKNPANCCSGCGEYRTRPTPLCRNCKALATRPPAISKVEIIDGEPCRKVPLTQGLYAIVDEWNYEWLMQWNWHARRHHTGSFYAGTCGIPYLGQEVVAMHRLVFGSDLGEVVDHARRNSLDNRRSQLRIGDRSKNAANQYRKLGKSGYRGVDYKAWTKRWQPIVSYSNVRLSIPSFSTPEEAAITRDRWARALYGNFAILNFPERLMLGC